MKIAMTHVDLPNETKGGVAAQAHHLANALTDRGHDVTMFTFSPPYDECRYTVRQLTSPRGMKRLRSFLLAGRLAATDFSGFDIVHTHGDNYLMWGAHPQVRTFHGSARDEAASALTHRRRLYQSLMVMLEKAGARVADVNIGVSATTRERISAISLTIPCGVDTGRFHPGPKSDRPSVLFVGTSGGRKRGQFLADVFQSQVLPRVPDAELWAVTDKPLEGNGIVNFGRVSFGELIDLFRRAWVFSLPSTYEGFGVPYIEAMASGTAVVASPNPGAVEVLDEGRYGVLAGDAGLGAAIAEMLVDDVRRAAYEATGLQRSCDYSWNRVAAAYEQVYARLAGVKFGSVMPADEAEPMPMRRV